MNTAYKLYPGVDSYYNYYALIGALISRGYSLKQAHRLAAKYAAK